MDFGSTSARYWLELDLISGWAVPPVPGGTAHPKIMPSHHRAEIEPRSRSTMSHDLNWKLRGIAPVRPQCNKLRAMSVWFFRDRTSSTFGPGRPRRPGRPLQKVGCEARPLWGWSPGPPGAAQTPKIDDFRFIPTGPCHNPTPVRRRKRYKSDLSRTAQTPQ